MSELDWAEKKAVEITEPACNPKSLIGRGWVAAISQALRDERKRCSEIARSHKPVPGTQSTRRLTRFEIAKAIERGEE